MNKMKSFLLGLVLVACASMPSTSISQHRNDCTPQTCALFVVDNGTSYDTRATFVNGMRVSGQAPAEKKSYFFVPRTALHDGGKCAVVSVTMENGLSWSSQSECAAVNEYFVLSIVAPLSASSFVVMASGQ